MTQKPVWYNSIRHRSATDAYWHAFFDRIGFDATYEPYKGYFYIPDFRLDQQYGPPFDGEIKCLFTTSDLAHHESKSYSGMIHSGRNILVFGRRPYTRNTDGRQDDGTGEVAAISNIYQDGYGSWTWATIGTQIILLPVCREEWPDNAEPADHEWIRDIFNDAVRFAKDHPGDRKTQPVLFDLEPEQEGDANGLVSGR